VTPCIEWEGRRATTRYGVTTKPRKTVCKNGHSRTPGVTCKGCIQMYNDKAPRRTNRTWTLDTSTGKRIYATN
jgi:hypothetical protein